VPIIRRNNCVYATLGTCYTRQSSTQNNKYQGSHKHSCFSWWWAHCCPKYVEIDKYTKNKFCTKSALITKLSIWRYSVHTRWNKFWLSFQKVHVIKFHLHLLGLNVFRALRHCTSPASPCNVAVEMGRKKKRLQQCNGVKCKTQNVLLRVALRIWSTKYVLTSVSETVESLNCDATKIFKFHLTLLLSVAPASILFHTAQIHSVHPFIFLLTDVHLHMRSHITWSKYCHHLLNIHCHKLWHTTWEIHEGL